MKKIIFALIIALLIFAYVIPKKSAEQILYGPRIQTTVRAIATPIGNFIWQIVGTQVSQLIDAAKQQINNQINSQKTQLEQQLNNQVNKSINNAVPTIPSTK